MPNFTPGQPVYWIRTPKSGTQRVPAKVLRVARSAIRIATDMTGAKHRVDPACIVRRGST